MWYHSPMPYHEHWTIIPTFTTIVVDGCLAVCVATLRNILRAAHYPVRISGVQWPQHVALLSPVCNAEVNNTWIVASTPPGFFMSQWEGSGKLCLVIYLSASTVGGSDLYALRYRSVSDLQDTTKPRRVITAGLQVKNGLPVLSNPSQL